MEGWALVINYKIINSNPFVTKTLSHSFRREVRDVNVRSE